METNWLLEFIELQVHVYEKNQDWISIKKLSLYIKTISFEYSFVIYA